MSTTILMADAVMFEFVCYNGQKLLLFSQDVQNVSDSYDNIEFEATVCSFWVL